MKAFKLQVNDINEFEKSKQINFMSLYGMNSINSFKNGNVALRRFPEFKVSINQYISQKVTCNKRLHKKYRNPFNAKYVFGAIHNDQKFMGILWGYFYYKIFIKECEILLMENMEISTQSDSPRK